MVVWTSTDLGACAYHLYSEDTIIMIFISSIVLHAFNRRLSIATIYHGLDITSYRLHANLGEKQPQAAPPSSLSSG